MKVYILILITVFGFVGCKSKKESAEFFKRANYHFKKNELDQALTFFSEAIEKDENFADAYNNRGVVYLKLEKQKEAQGDFEKAIALDGTFFEAKYNLAKLFSDQNKLTESEILFKDIQYKFKDSSDFMNHFGQNYIKMNKISEGLFALTESVRLNPKNVEAITNLGYVYTLQNENQKAKTEFEKALKINPNFAYALNNLALIYEKENKLDEAIEYLKKAEKVNPIDIIILNNLTLCYLETNAQSTAKNYLDKSERIAAENPYTIRNRGIYEISFGDAKNGINTLTNLEKAHPDVEYIYYFLGKGYLKIGDKNSACKHIKTGKTLKDGKSELLEAGC